MCVSALADYMHECVWYGWYYVDVAGYIWPVCVFFEVENYYIIVLKQRKTLHNAYFISSINMFVLILAEYSEVSGLSE